MLSTSLLYHIFFMNYELFQNEYKKTIKKIFLINMTKEINYHFSEIVTSGIQRYLQENKKIGIIVNKKWFSGGILCHDCGHVPQCSKCSVSISFYKTDWWEKLWMCHICKAQYALPSRCPSCRSEKIREFWLWTQKVVEYIEKEFNQKSIILESKSVNSPNKIKKFREQASQHQIIIWTSLLNTPVKWIKFDLLIYLNADIGLNIPDYTANKKNFWFLYEWFTKHKTTNILVQTFNPDHYSIRSACKLDEEWFNKQDNVFRKENNYPPFWEIYVLLYKNEIEKRLFNKVDKLYKEMLFLQKKYWLEEELEIYSTPPLVYRVFWKYRYNIIIKWKQPWQVKNFVEIIYSKLKIAQKWFKIDTEPMWLV